MEGVIIMKSLNDNEKKTDKETCVSWFASGLFCALLVVAFNIVLPFEVAFLWSMLTAMVFCILVVIW